MNKEQFKTIGAFKLLSTLDESNTVQIGIKDVKVINEYITNLQKENEELKSKNDILEFRMKQNDKMVICERYRILKQRDDYKQQVDKAIEYSKNCLKNLTTIDEEEARPFKSIHNNYLEILNGGDE